MSSVKTQSRYDASRHMNYISTAPFNAVFFTYTYVKPDPSNSFAGYGTLTAVSGATSVNCPAGRILRATNKKLYPDAAGLPTTGANAVADRTPLVGVFDYHTQLSGFIDPNNSVFALYNGDKPVDSIDGIDSNGHNTHKGMSVYTGGTVTSVGDITTTTGNIAATAGTVTAGGQIRSSTVTVIGTTSPQSINGTLGQVFTLAQAASTAMTINCGTVPPAGSIVYIVITPAGIAALITWGTNIKGLNVTPTASKVTTCSFVSDGTNLNQFGAITST